MTSNTEQGSLKLLSQSTSYIDDPLDLFTQLTDKNEQQASLLLESAEIDSKENLKSLLLLDAALEIKCFGRNVSFTALSDNGQNLCAYLADKLQSQFELTTNSSGFSLHYDLPQDSDEDSRLKASSPINALRSIIEEVNVKAEHPHALFLGGAFAFDLIAGFEQLPKVPDSDNTCPDYQFYVAESLLIIDHQKQECEILATVFTGKDEAEIQAKQEQRVTALHQHCTHFQASSAEKTQSIVGELTVDIDDNTFCHQVEELKEYIRQGDIFQVVPSRCFTLPCPSPLAAYRKLKQTNPSPYMFYMQTPEFSLFGASPECAIKYDSDSRDVEIYPIAGTRRRGFRADGSIDLDLDGRIELELRQDKKETSEHMMLVDLARNDVARISEPGTRHVAELLKVDRYSHVMHLVSRVVGKLRRDLDALHAYQASMNMGTLTGAPKIRAAELIRQTEGKRRGSYGGAVGYLNGHGDMNTCIVIRSAFVKDGLAHVQAGAGVVYDSNPQAEADETRNKAAAVLNAIALAHNTTLADLLDKAQGE